MISFKQYLVETSDETSTIRMIAGIYKNLNINVQPVTVTHIKSRYDRIKNCFYNAEMIIKKNSSAKYVLGFITVHEVPIEHAWVRLSTGEYVDSTINTPDKYNYYSCLELSHDELLHQIKLTKTKPGYVDLSTLNRFTKSNNS